MQSLLQTELWAAFKSRHGWQANWVRLDGQPKPILVLERQLPLGQVFCYSPELRLTETSSTHLQQLARMVKTLCPAVMAYRLELLEELGDSATSLIATLTNAGYQKSFEEVQPEHRQWIDLSIDETTLMSQMKEKGRYNTRLALKRGVTSRTSTDTKDVEVFYHLFSETAIRDGFRVRTKQYFEDLCQTLFDNHYGELVIAEYEGQALAAAIITYYDGMASYLYGASSNSQRNLMAPYAMHWTAIHAAKKRDCHIYDLLQIAPSDSDSTHSYANLTRFKQQFGGRRVDLVGGWDYVYRPALYQGFKVMERLRRG